MIVALIDSGLGLLPTAAHLRSLKPQLDLILATDPDEAPWGPRPRGWVVQRALGMVRDCLDRGAEAIVVACNTASVSALHDIRRFAGPSIPVVGTVPAIKPAAAQCSSVAIWATAATTASPYQRDLVAQYGGGAAFAGSVACHGLADAIDAGDEKAINAAIDTAVAATPLGVNGVVLGCTHYPLVRQQIAERFPQAKLFDSARAVATQTARRLEALGRPIGGSGTVTVVTSGRVGALPASARTYQAGKILFGE